MSGRVVAYIRTPCLLDNILAPDHRRLMDRCRNGSESARHQAECDPAPLHRPANSTSSIGARPAGCRHFLRLDSGPASSSRCQKQRDRLFVDTHEASHECEIPVGRRGAHRLQLCSSEQDALAMVLQPVQHDPPIRSEIPRARAHRSARLAEAPSSRSTSPTATVADSQVPHAGLVVELATPTMLTPNREVGELWRG